MIVQNLRRNDVDHVAAVREFVCNCSHTSCAGDADMRCFIGHIDQPICYFLRGTGDRDCRFTNAGKSEKPVPQAILTRFSGLFDKAVFCQCHEQASRCGLVQPRHSG